MTRITNQAVFIFFAVVCIALLYLLASILTPFLLGALFAYLADPLVKKLEKRKFPHLLAVALVFLLMFGLIVLLFIIFVPIVQTQMFALSKMLPDMIIWVQKTLLPWLQEYVNINTIKTTLSANLSKVGMSFSTVLASGHALVQFVINLVLTPVVTFYLLRDWDYVRTQLLKIIPTSVKPSLLAFINECDEVLSAFFRGQLLVMLSLAFIYAVGLSLIGLKTGLVIGILGGLLSIVPFVGSIFVLVFASLASLLQFTTWGGLMWVLVVYLVGQGTESYFLTPYLVGERIGLHPVVVIFAVMAGAALFGFFGVLIALPAAAVIKVLLRFIKRRFAGIWQTEPA